jgi:hypothetical protein
MAVQQHHCWPVTSVAKAQDHLADVQLFEREIVKHRRVRMPGRRPS